ncbi:hypothetical protein TG4357_02668 [Thalassovita gelatinovora]|uniref:Uncharacterized protein n=1 Tax=Thalassovita gelatinovora TaxID=53501 RepID=A0A0P1G1V3_THAGE|nr:hypothetical protein [Thalassovita gelatinovora]QIZ79793.1 hypothetical protein HFZ77_04505 [Thalassovita gelatinovora]CUH66833.1 hypothetical protein TG4357_02668 [Thalassovita gelatinovora]SEQ43611.1 hypothetical protein SAMN04488043_105205 [Thalassovita gelatinovora]
MKDQHICACQLMIAASAALCMHSVRDENYQVHVDILRECLPDAAHGPADLGPVWTAARDLSQSEDGRAQDAALTRLNTALRRYFVQRVGALYAAWSPVVMEG